MNSQIIVPFLIGQRRDGLRRIRDVDDSTWDVLEFPEFLETCIEDTDEKLKRMGEIYYSLSERVKGLVSDGERPICIAGDCVSTLGVLAGLQKAGKPPDCILWLDAHGDFHTWETSITKYIGGMPLAMLTGHGDWKTNSPDAFKSMLMRIGVDPYPEEKIILSDARDLDLGEKEALQESKIIKCNISNVCDFLPAGSSIYVHWDTDVLDAEVEAPALKYHVKKGPSFPDIEALFMAISLRMIVAISVSAWHTEKDSDNRTALACLNTMRILKKYHE